MNIELLNRTIEPAENPGLETTDPRLADIVTLAQNGDYQESAAQAQAVFEEDIFDVRIVGFFLYGIYLETDIFSLHDIFQTLIRLFQENWEAIGPVKKREKHAQTGLNWLIKQLAKILQYEEDKKSDNWNRWLKELTSEDITQIIEAGDELQQTLESILEDASRPLLEGLLKINEWLANLQQLVYKEPEPEVEPETEPDEPESQQPIETTDQKVVSPAMISADDTVVAGSYHLRVLLNKIEVFEQLISQEKFIMAALVAEDINDIVANFDPKVYFPGIFSRYSYLLARNISEISSFDGHKNTVEWQAMKELYKVDLDSFMIFDTDNIDPEFFQKREAPTGDEGYDEGYDEDYDGTPQDDEYNE
jgi:hypothetical protein